MSAVILISLLFISILLLVIEVLLIPGTTWFGVVGFLLGVISIYFIFRQLGAETGFVTLGIFGLILVGLLYYGFSAKTWSRFALKNTISSRVNEEERILPEVGQTGIAISELKPAGKAEFNNQYLEVHTQGDFLDAGVAIRVIRIENNKILVEKA
jgi:membrane-bound ClpP family serine protease